ncbi:MAG: phosphate ABC transporter permease subunit PstC [Bacteriovoracaceae bacterium]
MAMALLCMALLFSLVKMAAPSMSVYGLSFFNGLIWDPSSDVYTARPFILGTLVTSLIALIISAPLAVLIAIYIIELAPARLRKFLRTLIEVMAGVPSIIIGLWGIFIVVPLMRDSVAPFCNQYLSFIPFLAGTSFGVGVFTAAIILSIMIIPIIASISCEIFSTIPRTLKEAALSLGASRLEMIQIAMVKPSTAGIIGATILGLARAMGETMAVTMVIGNSPKMFSSLWEPGATLSSIIANDYAEASPGLHIASLGYLAIILMVISFVMNRVALTIRKRMIKKQGQVV